MMNESIPILLVEDDEIDTEAVKRALRKANIVNPLHCARDGVEALELLSGAQGEPLRQPCLMLLDINMPRMNGFELLQNMRGNDTMRHNIVFMLTTSARPEDKTRAYNLHTAGYILKEHVSGLASFIGDYCKINQFPENAAR